MPGACCAVCFNTRNLTEHHIHPKEFKESYPNGPEHINERANLIVICSGCHSAIHDKRPYQQMARDIKQKLRRRLKTRPEWSEEQKLQSTKDQTIQREIWKNLLVTLANPQYCKQISAYRSILRVIERLHAHVIEDHDAA